MRFTLSLILAIVSMALILTASPAQEILSTEPGVFLYEYNEKTGKVERNYYSQQDAKNRLEQDKQRVLNIFAQMAPQQGQSSIDPEAVAQWIVFFDQWTLYQQWLKQTYNLQKLDKVFVAVPGVTPKFAKTTQKGPPRRKAGRAGEAEQLQQRVRTTAFGPGGYPTPGMPEGALPAGAPSTGSTQAAAAPPGAETIASFVARTQEDRQATILAHQQAHLKQVNKDEEERYQKLMALLDKIEAFEEAKQERKALLAMRHRDITDLQEIISNRMNATELNIDGKTYLFSQQPLSKIPEGAINITTPNLTPYDILNPDGTVKKTP